jgi:hypothetical protein
MPEEECWDVAFEEFAVGEDGGGDGRNFVGAETN